MVAVRIDKNTRRALRKNVKKGMAVSESDYLRDAIRKKLRDNGGFEREHWKNVGEKPQWLIKLEEKHHPYNIRHFAFNLLDHWRWMDGKVVAASYGCDYKELKKFVEFCEKENLQFHLIGHCEYHPNTFMVTVEPKEEISIKEV